MVDAGRFRWKQSEFEVTLLVPLPADATSASVACEVKRGSIRLQIGSRTVLDDAWFVRSGVVADDAYWEVDEDDRGRRCVAIHAPKCEAYLPWEMVLEGEYEAPDDTVTTRCYLDVEIDGSRTDRIVVGLYGNVCPRTCENFRMLCTGEAGEVSETMLVAPGGARRGRGRGRGKGKGKGEEVGQEVGSAEGDGPLYGENGRRLMCYRGSPFHRIVPGFLIQGGDFTLGNGKGGASVYGEAFPDENFAFKHNRPGLLCMANRGPNTNGSQFYIVSKPAPHLDGSHVVFGEVLQGMEAVKAIELAGSEDGAPTKRAVIVGCGEC